MKRPVFVLGGIFLFVGAVAIVRASSIDRLAATGTASPIPISTRTQTITGHECQAYAVDGKVAICHATGSHYNLLEVSVSACFEGHGDHNKDTIAAIGGTCAE